MNREQRSLAVWSSVACALALALLGGCLERRSDEAPTRGRCTACHGSSTRPGSDVERGAPPVDLGGGTDSNRRGVGAHQIHLQASATHGKVSCAECHLVPDSVESAGHTDTRLPAEVTLGALAEKGGHQPEYVPDKSTCTNTYCHRAADPIWTAPRSSSEACGSCHGLPPPAPHPQFQDCSRCHAEVVDESRNFIAPDRHVNGTIDVKGLDCHSCHGSPQSNAPPSDLAGNTDRASLGVGAHQVHLAGGQHSRALACGECHSVPAAMEAPGHIDDTPNAEVIFTGIATTSKTAPSWDRESRACTATWCHGPENPSASTSPAWTLTTGSLACASCHGTPPKPPHPQIDRCSLCHSSVIGSDDVTIVNRALHVNGTIDVTLPTACNSCHGSETNPAPPRDLAGNLTTTARGVGAHQSHLVENGVTRPVACNECHVVPQSVSAAGHMDSALPAELLFSGVAVSGGAQPSFDGIQCSASYCHGASFPNGAPSGGTNTQPIWTAVEAGQAVCGSCHGLPPPPPHYQADPMPLCSTCHANMTSGFGFIDPKLHVDGKVQ